MRLYIFPGAHNLFYQQGNHNSCILSSLASALHYMGDEHRRELPVLHYHKIMAIYPYPFLVVIIHLLSWIKIINSCICILTGSPEYFFMIVYVIQKIGGNKNCPNSLNVMVNYHYHGKNRVITR